jgi:hypothetical protein
MNDTNSPKQQIVEQIKNSTNILVTVSTNPSVDELSAAIGLTLMLNKLDKHATAVFSGAIPPAIQFLEPDKTLEDTVDSLRDFIIALDKEKADRLRYRVEDDVVRIFITPYRTRINEDDLEFSHGDFNVELVLALGVENQKELDKAIAAHGKILHDATVATLSSQNQKSELGSIDWQDQSASSLCEMLVAISEALKSGLLDEQIATALLTGIVSATNRFSNDHTSPKAMTMAAQLMAAGANQQLISAQLEASSEITSPEETEDNNASDETSQENTEDSAPTSAKLRTEDEKSDTKSKKKDLGEMKISHQEEESSELEESEEEVTPPTESEPRSLPQVQSATIEEHDRTIKQQAGEEALDEALTKLNETPQKELTPTLKEEIEQATQEAHEAASVAHDTPELPSSRQANEEPTMGGTFSATSKEAHDLAIQDQLSAQNKVIMTHDEEPAPTVSTKGKTVQPLSQSSEKEVPPTETTPSRSGQTLADIEADVKKRESLPQSSGNSLPLPPPPPLPDFSTLPPLPDVQPSTSPEPVNASAPIPPPATQDPTQQLGRRYLIQYLHPNFRQ